jgi:hypothetical protein
MAADKDEGRRQADWAARRKAICAAVVVRAADLLPRDAVRETQVTN